MRCKFAGSSSQTWRLEANLLLLQYFQKDNKGVRFECYVLFRKISVLIEKEIITYENAIREIEFPISGFRKTEPFRLMQKVSFFP